MFNNISDRSIIIKNDIHGFILMMKIMTLHAASSRSQARGLPSNITLLYIYKLSNLYRKILQ